MSQKIVVVGAGQAACSFVSKLRKHDTLSQIIMIGDEESLPYQRPPLSKKYVTGEMEAIGLLLKSADWYEENNVTCISGVSVRQIDRDAHTVSLSNGDNLQWDKLMLATGSTPRSLPAAIGGDLDAVYLLRSLDDADAMRAELVADRRVVIIGGGYIGLEAAAVAAKSGLKVTLVEAAERILQRVACAQTSDYFRSLHAVNGVEIIEGVGLNRFEGNNGRACAAVLSDGTRIEADFILVGIGIIPNVQLAENAGLDVDGGIVVNKHCETSDPDIYAAGDCAVFEYDGMQTRLESVQNAIDQAECAADNLTGNAREYLPYPWFWSDQFDVKLQIAGLNRGFDEVIIRVGEREGSMSHWYFNEGKFIAVDAMNDARAYMVGKKLLERGEGPTQEQVADTSLELKSLL